MTRSPDTTPIIRIHPDSPVPPFEQIRTSVKALILDGTLAAGSRLPSVRQLAADLRVAPGTVQRAYQHLQDDGLVHSHARRGAVVVDRPQTVRRPEDLLTAALEFVDTGRQSGASQDELRNALEAALLMSRGAI